MKLAIIGSRGIPARYGGFETFAEEIAIRIYSLGKMEVVVFCEKSDENKPSHHGVKLEYSKYKKSINPLLFYLDSIVYASKTSDVLLVLGTGGSLFYFIPKLFKKKIITNVDGIESRRGKWSWLKKIFLKVSEHVAINLSDKIIADSEGIKKYLRKTYKIQEQKMSVIEYGAYVNRECNSDVTNKYSLLQQEYYLVVSRLEPENNIHMILQGFIASNSQKKLVIVGNLIRNKYVDGLLLQRSEKVVFLGGIYDKKELQAIRYSCFAYIHGHSVGGTNPSLLEALGSGNITICHNNEFNREVTSSRMYYFQDSASLAETIKAVESYAIESIEQKKQFAIERITGYYNWDRIALEYINMINGEGIMS